MAEIPIKGHVFRFASSMSGELDGMELHSSILKIFSNLIVIYTNELFHLSLPKLCIFFLICIRSVNQPGEKKSDLKIDFREQQSGIVGEIEKLTGQLNIEMSMLPTGDYWIGDKIIVERKTLSDFLLSIKTGRIFQQAYRIAQSGKNGLLILEGDKSMVNSSSMSRKAVQGALIHITVFLGIPVIRSLNIHETATILIDIFHQCQKLELPRQKQIISGTQGIRVTKKQRQKLFILRNIPRIGTKKALMLLRSLHTIENIINASPADLMKLQGIGFKLAGRIDTLLHEPF